MSWRVPVERLAGGARGRHGSGPVYRAAAFGADRGGAFGEQALGFGMIGSGFGVGRSVAGVEQLAAEGEAVAAPAVGEEAVVADTAENVGEGMQKKAADEHVGVERHQLALAALPIIL